MARSDIPPENRAETKRLVLEQLVDCPECNVTQDVLFVAPPEVYDLEDLYEPPVAEVRCVSCGVVFEATYEGWTVHDEA